jgi:5-formyltetrahydrofolate cyclo-ligase
MGDVKVSTKNSLRLRLKAERSALTPPAAAGLSARITDRLIQTIDWSRIRSVHSYVPIRSQREVDTWLLLRYIWQTWPAIVVAVPGAHYRPVFVDEQTARENIRSLGPVQRPGERPVFDLIVVPMLGFDSACYRLGHGGGYYDRFLAGQPTALKVGLGYECTYVSPALPHEPHDQPVDLIVTEERLISRD